MESKSLQVFVDFFCKYLSSLNWSRLLPVIRFARIYYSARGVNKSIKVLSQTVHNLGDRRKAKIPTVGDIQSCHTRRSLFLGRFWTKIQSDNCFETVSTPGLLLDGFFSRPLSLLYWFSQICQVPVGWQGIFRWICLQNAQMDFFPTALTAFPQTDLDFTDCCMKLFSMMFMC